MHVRKRGHRGFLAVPISTLPHYLCGLQVAKIKFFQTSKRTRCQAVPSVHLELKKFEEQAWRAVAGRIKSRGYRFGMSTYVNSKKCAIMCIDLDRFGMSTPKNVHQCTSKSRCVKNHRGNKACWSSCQPLPAWEILKKHWELATTKRGSPIMANGEMIRWSLIRAANLHQSFIELDDGKILTGKTDQFDCKKPMGFRLRFSPTNQSIESWENAKWSSWHGPMVAPESLDPLQWWFKRPFNHFTMLKKDGNGRWH